MSAAPAKSAQPVAAKPVQKTMLGMMSPLAGQVLPAEPAPAAAAPKEPVPVAPAAGKVPAQTMLGMPSPVRGGGSPTPLVVEPGQAPGRLLTPEVDAPKRAEPAPAAPAKGPPATNLTMVGVAPLAAPAPQKPARAAIPAQSNHTMLGTAPAPQVALPPSAPAPAPRKRADGTPRSFTPVPTESTPSASGTASLPPAPPVKRGLGLVLAVAGVLALGLAGLAAWLLTGGPEVAVKVVPDSGEGGVQGGSDALEVDVPGAAPGARVRFGGQEYPLNAGRARFPLRADALALGDNALAISVVSAGGSVDTATVHLQVDYRVRADLAPLSAQPPGIDVVIDARPGSRVSLDGSDLPLDARGRGTRRYPIPPQSGASFQLAARYRIDLPGGGTPVDGAVHVALPVTTAQIDRPGPDVITDQALLEVGGEVEPSAEVVVEGTAVAVNGGRFLYRAHLPQPGEYKLQVVARAPGKAPRVIDIRVRRVSDLTMAAAAFKHDPALTYARIAQNPTIYRGQAVAFDGRVYNVQVQGGRSVLQILALDCPGGARCPLWVDYGQATEAVENTWVRVLGTVQGEQQFRTAQGQVQTVPSVTAQYVLKLAR